MERATISSSKGSNGDGDDVLRRDLFIGAFGAALRGVWEAKHCVLMSGFEAPNGLCIGPVLE